MFSPGSRHKTGEPVRPGRRLARMNRLRVSALRFLLVAAFLLAPVSFPQTALALCAPSVLIDEAIANANVVLVGTVTDLSNESRWARVEVEEVWKGPDLPAVVVVRGGPEPGVWSSVDRTYRAVRYLFIVQFDGRVLTDSVCGNTAEWSDNLLVFRPADWRGPAGAAGESGDARWPIDPGAIAGAALLALVVIGGSAWVARRRHD